jgi:hypothetical protein
MNDTDIVERLRNDDVVWGVRPSLAFEAADEIERLREALKSISKIPNSESAYGIIQVFVDDALKEKE